MITPRARTGRGRPAPGVGCSSSEPPPAEGDSRRRHPHERGIDTKKVRRKDAPPLRSYRTGSVADALRTAASPRLLHKARKKLMKGVYARSTLGPRRSRLRVVKKILKAAGHPWLPISPSSLKDVMATLHHSGYRSLQNHVGDWRQEHVKAGHNWTDGLIALRKDLLRSAVRGQGPPRRAETFGAERLPNATSADEAPVVPSGPLWPQIMLVIAICWLLRDAETSGLLGEQASIDVARREATLDLGPTKMDPEGRGCARTLGCLCAAGLQGPCPYCAMASLLPARRAAGWGDKDPLFPTRRGRAPKAKAVVLSWRRLLNRRMTGHSTRREGAQLLARRDVPLYLIQFLGRWGGDTVARYVGEALRQQLAKAATAKAAGHRIDGPDGVTKHLKKTIEDIVQEALDSRQEQMEIADKVCLEIAAAPAAPSAPAFQSQRQVQGRKDGRPHGLVHEVLLADLCMPTASWLTLCSWHFGEAEHEIFSGSAVTCARCTQKRVVLERARTGASVSQ